jgi:hypothetical protein
MINDRLAVIIVNGNSEISTMQRELNIFQIINPNWMTLADTLVPIAQRSVNIL